MLVGCRGDVDEGHHEPIGEGLTGTRSDHVDRILAIEGCVHGVGPLLQFINVDLRYFSQRGRGHIVAEDVEDWTA